jgi:Spy/CpxP family protein refolding chaperone
MKRFVSQPWVALTLIFLLGLGTGVLLTIALGPRFSHPPGEQEMRNRWMMHLTHRLDLTADQQAKIQPIVTDAEARIEGVHRDDVDRISSILKDTTRKISALLTPDQQKELDQMERNRERMFMTHMGGPGMRDRGPGHGPGGPDGIDHSDGGPPGSPPGPPPAP